VQFVFAKNMFLTKDVATMRKWRQYIQRGGESRRQRTPSTLRSKSVGNANHSRFAAADADHKLSTRDSFDFDKSKSSNDILHKAMVNAAADTTQSATEPMDKTMFVCKSEMDQMMQTLMGAITNELKSQRSWFESQQKAHTKQSETSQLKGVAALQATVLQMDKEMARNNAAVLAAIKEQNTKRTTVNEQSEVAMGEMRREIANLSQQNTSLLAVVEELKSQSEERKSRDAFMAETAEQQLIVRLKEMKDAIPAMVDTTLRSCFDEIDLAERLRTVDDHSDTEPPMLAITLRVDELADSVQNILSVDRSQSEMIEIRKEIADLSQQNTSLLAAVEGLTVQNDKAENINTRRDASVAAEHLKEIKAAIPAMVETTLRSCFEDIDFTETLRAADDLSDTESERAVIALTERVDALSETLQGFISADRKENMSLLVEVVAEHHRQTQMLDGERQEQRWYAREMDEVEVFTKEPPSVAVESTLSCLNAMLCEAVQDRERARTAVDDIECVMRKYDQERRDDDVKMVDVSLAADSKELKLEMQAMSRTLKNFDLQIQAKMGDLGAGLSFLSRRLIGRTE